MTQATPTSFIDAYDAKTAIGGLQPDVAQRKAALALDALAAQLQAPERRRRDFAFWRKNNAAHGLYLWGDVGRGKTMLMDLFVENLMQDPSLTGAVRRVPFPCADAGNSQAPASLPRSRRSR